MEKLAGPREVHGGITAVSIISPLAARSSGVEQGLRASSNEKDSHALVIGKQTLMKLTRVLPTPTKTEDGPAGSLSNDTVDKVTERRMSTSGT